MWIRVQIRSNDGTNTVEYPNVALDRKMVANKNPFLFVSDAPGPSANSYIDAFQKLHGYSTAHCLDSDPPPSHLTPGLSPHHSPAPSVG